MKSRVKYVWLYPALGWIGLLGLLAATLAAAYGPLGAFSIPLNLLIAALCVGLIGVLFMNLLRSSVLIRLASAAGIFWILFMFVMTAGDYLSR